MLGPIAVELSAWVDELDACDGYVVLLVSSDGHRQLDAFGPYPGIEAVQVADRLAGSPDRRAHVVRFHRQDQAMSGRRAG